MDGAVAGVSISTTNIAFTYSSAGEATYRIRATHAGLGRTADSPPFRIKAIASASADILAPTIPTGLVAGSTLVNGLAVNTILCDPVSDPAVSGRNTSGVKEIRWFRDGSQVGTTSVSAGALLRLIGADLGSPTTAGSTSQSGADYDVTGNGATVGGTADLAQFASVRVTGNFIIIATLNSLSNAVAGVSVAGLMARAVGANSERAVFLQTSSTRTRMRARATAGQASVVVATLDPATWPIKQKMVREGDIFSTYTLQGSSWQLLGTREVALGASVDIGLFASYGQSGATTVVADFNQVNVVTNDITSPQFIDSGVAYSTAFSYTATAADLTTTPNVSALSAAVTVTSVALPVDTTPPSIPTNPAGTANGQTAIVWSCDIASDVSGIRGYVWSFSTTLGGTYTPVAEQPTPSYTLTGLTSSTTRYAKVHAIDNAGNVGSDTTAVSATTAASPPPAFTAPTISGITALSTTSLRITHTAVAGADHYIVREATTQNGAYVVLTAFDHVGLTVDRTGLTAAVTRWYQVAASNSDESTIGPYSVSVSGTTQAAPSTLRLLMDFESGSIAPGVASGNTPTVSTDQHRSGTKCMKSELIRATSPTSYRTEAHLANESAAGRAKFDEDDWYGVSIFVPTGYNTPVSTTWESHIQWHASEDPGDFAVQPPLTLNLEGGEYRLSMKGYTTQPMPEDPTYVDTQTFKFPVLLGQWQDFVFHVRWSFATAPKNGMLEVWRNGVKLFTRTGFVLGYKNTRGPYVKIGLYKGSWRSRTTPTDTVSSRTIYHDEVRIKENVVNGYADVVAQP